MKHFIRRFFAYFLIFTTTSLLQAQTFQWGLAARQGDRPTMEDEHTHEVRAHDAFFGIFDGHGGLEAADYASKRLYKHFFHKELVNPLKTEQNLVAAFEQTDQEILKKDTNSGAVAVVAYVSDELGSPHTRNQAFIAWAGDSRAIIVRNGKVIFTTFDHNLKNPEEIARIKNRGGNIINGRVQGILGVPRALGDRLVKNVGVIGTPEVQKVAIEPGDLIILACDGVWDVLSNEGAAKIVSDIVNGKVTLKSAEKEFPKESIKRNPYERKPIEQGDNELLRVAARALRDDAYDKGSADNISAMVVLYTPEIKQIVAEEKEQKESAEGTSKETKQPFAEDTKGS